MVQQVQSLVWEVPHAMHIAKKKKKKKKKELGKEDRIQLCESFPITFFPHMPIKILVSLSVRWDNHNTYLTESQEGNEQSGKYLEQCLTNRILFFGLFVFFRATSMAHGGSQARGLIRAIAASLCHSHSNARSKQCL